MRLMTIPNHFCADALIDGCDRVANMYGDGRLFDFRHLPDEYEILESYVDWRALHDEEPYLPQVINNDVFLLSNWDELNGSLLFIIEETAAKRRLGSDKAQLTNLYKKIKGLML